MSEIDVFWTEKRSTAALLVAEDELTQAEIAVQAGVSPKTIERWKKTKKFAERVAQIEKAVAKRILARGIARRDKRVRALDDRWERMKALLAARQADPALRGIPGGTTGLIVHDVKGVGKGDDFQLIDTYSFDASLVKEMREHEKQAAQEVGQWVEKLAPTDPTGQEEYSGDFGPADRKRLVESLLARLAGPGPCEDSQG